jgi:hypothetical protein
MGLLVAVIAWQNISFYMFEYRQHLYFSDPNGEYGMEVGRMAHGLGKDYKVYVLGEPRVFAGFPTLPFAAPGVQFQDLGLASLPGFYLPAGQKAAFFAIPENQALLDDIRQKYPGGRSGEVYRLPKPDEVLFEYYILDR